jgi:hypothetical protein
MEMIKKLDHQQIVFILSNYKDEVSAKHTEAMKNKDHSNTFYYGGQLDAIEELYDRLLFGGSRYAQ